MTAQHLDGALVAGSTAQAASDNASTPAAILANASRWSDRSLEAWRRDRTDWTAWRTLMRALEQEQAAGFKARGEG